MDVKMVFLHGHLEESIYMGAGIDGCQDGVPPWASGEEHLHGAATLVSRARSRREGLFIAEIAIWAEVVAEVMVQIV